ncbi:MAG: hypothetical protein J6M23_08285 [Bacteroidales bacterium]|nr:hypothetical protein [Bacteroidales bacterium]
MKNFHVSAKCILAASFTAGLLLAAHGCGTQRKKIEMLEAKKVAAQLALSRNEIEEERKIIEAPRRDTLRVVDPEGREVLIMKAVRDEASGEMVAHEVLDAAVITARFRNVAERHGRIDLRFEVIVPPEMQDTKWQLRFYPDMFILQDSIRLEPVIITGEEYRRNQLRGYEQYEKWLAGIISDTTRFIDLRNLEIFIKRNLPELHRFKNDTSYVSDMEFETRYGLNEQQIVDHYTDKFAKRRNEDMKGQRGNMFRKYVKAPIVTEGIRVDSVIRNTNNELVYHYTQTISTRPKLKKVDIVLSGDIYEGPQRIYTMDRSKPLTFYISSVSAFTDNTERYMTKTISRRAAANTACYVDFPVGKYNVVPGLGNNGEELSRIRGNILELLHNQTFDIDSIVIAASASPEGSRQANDVLSKHRAEAVADYFDRFIRHYRDSVKRDERMNSFAVMVDEHGREHVGHSTDASSSIPDIQFHSRSNGENWEMLNLLVDTDTVLTADNKKAFIKLLEISDVDAREKTLSQEPYYHYMRESLYPRLRTVRFDFHLHRKGMIQETVETTELDTVYMKGVELLKDRDYEQALKYLKDYKDFNTAIAYVSLDYNASAMAILKDLEKTAPVNYMLALLYARNDDDQNAVQHYLASCKQDHSYVFRGNLDPEIYVLIQRYGLNKQDEDEFADSY